jgi:hypothetical protein
VGKLGGLIAPENEGGKNLLGSWSWVSRVSVSVLVPANTESLRISLEGADAAVSNEFSTFPVILGLYLAELCRARKSSPSRTMSNSCFA